MQNIISEKPYSFVPASLSRIGPRLFFRILPRYLSREFGVESVRVEGAERLKASLKSGDGIILAPNHCRESDPFVVSMAARELDEPFFIIASSHIFLSDRLRRWVLPRIGVFSVYREGLDRESLKFATTMLARSERPVLIFPEGLVTRTNDRLKSLMEGVAFVAHAAASRKALAHSGRVVVHPVAIRYRYAGTEEELHRSLDAVLSGIERRLTWSPQDARPLRERIDRVGMALLALQEIEYIGTVQTGTHRERLDGIIDAILVPFETEWLRGRAEGDVIARVKALRSAILAGMIVGRISHTERDRRRAQLRSIDLAQEIFFFPTVFFGENPTPEQLLEAVECFEESLTGSATVHRPLHAVMEIGEAIEVGAKRERGNGEDPLMAKLRVALESGLARLVKAGKSGGAA